MPKTQVGETNVTEVIVISLAFRVKACEDGLYCAEMLLLNGDKVVGTRTSVASTLGHAIGHMDNIADGWATDMIERKAEDYFNEVLM